MQKYVLRHLFIQVNIWKGVILRHTWKRRSYLLDYILLFVSFIAPFWDYGINDAAEETPNNIFIESIHLLTHNSQPALDMSKINIHEAHSAFVLH